MLVRRPAGDQAGHAGRSRRARSRSKSEDHPYVSRGALKLVKGARHVRDRSGAARSRSTSARRPAASPTCCCSAAPRKVYAIDVGYGQLAWSLRQDPRVVVLERQNARNMDLDARARAVRPRRDRRVVHLARRSCCRASPSCCARRGQADRRAGQAAVRGRPRARSARAASCATRRCAAAPSTKIAHVGRRARLRRAGDDVESPITGPAGNVEYLLLLRTA